MVSPMFSSETLIICALTINRLLFLKLVFLYGFINLINYKQHRRNSDEAISKIKNIKILYPNDINVQIDIADKYKKALELSQFAYQLIREAVIILENSLKLSLSPCEDLQIFSVAPDDFYKKENYRFQLSLYID